MKKKDSATLIKDLHEQLVHPGASAMYNTIRGVIYVPKLQKCIHEVLQRCEICKIFKRKSYKKVKDFHITAKEPFKKLSTDIYGPFMLKNFKHKKRGREEKGYFLTITDIYTRYTDFVFLYNVTSKELIKAFEKWIDRFGNPDGIISDNGKQYTSSAFKNYLKEKGIKQIHTPIYHPKSNGISERLNQTISEVLSMNKRKEINDVCRLISRRHNFNFNRTIGSQPISLLNGYHFLDPYKRVKSSKGYTGKIIQEINKPEGFKVDDQVYVRCFNATKIGKKFTGPYTITHVGKNNFWYKLGGLNEWIHLNDIKA